MRRRIGKTILGVGRTRFATAVCQAVLSRGPVVDVLTDFDMNGFAQWYAEQKRQENLRETAEPEIKDEVYFYEGLAGKGIPNERVRRAVQEVIQSGRTRAFHVTDTEQVREQARWWFRNYPGIKPHYAVKSNNSNEILSALVEEGFGFDCASAIEISQVLALGGRAEDIVFSNTCKTDDDLLAGKAAGVKLTVFDSVSELEKLHRLDPGVDVMLRIYADSECWLDLSGKAGATKQEWPELLRACKDLGLNLRGAMFHIGSGHNADPSAAYGRALSHTADLFRSAAEYGFELDTVDIGGGHPQEFVTEIGEILQEARQVFPPNTRWLGEPGRLICAPVQTVAARVIGRKRNSVTIDDGVHGSFSCILQEKDHPLPATTPTNESDLRLPGEAPRKCREMKVYGPTCDGLDIVSDGLPVAEDIKVGDWLVFNGMGAYTQVTASNFNGIHRSSEMVIPSTQADWAVGA